MNLTFSRNILNIHVGYFHNKKVFPDFFQIDFEINLLRIEAKTFYDLTRDSIANNFAIDVYCKCLQILYQIAF